MQVSDQQTMDWCMQSPLFGGKGPMLTWRAWSLRPRSMRLFGDSGRQAAQTDTIRPGTAAAGMVCLRSEQTEAAQCGHMKQGLLSTCWLRESCHVMARSLWERVTQRCSPPSARDSCQPWCMSLTAQLMRPAAKMPRVTVNWNIRFMAPRIWGGAISTR